MHVLQSAELLQLWEQGAEATAVQRGLLLLTAIFPNVSSDSLAQLSIGQRNRRLLWLRQALFGDQLESVIHCPECQERLEFQFSASDMLDEAENDSEETIRSIQTGEFNVQFRLPNSLDMATIPVGSTVEEAETHLVESCLISINQAGKTISTTAAPKEIVQQAIVAMAAQDKQADIQLSLECPACAHSWSAPFDIVLFLWAEIERWAFRILQEVHILASAYGWSEQAILQMSPWRRHIYLEMVLI